MYRCITSQQLIKHQMSKVGGLSPSVRSHCTVPVCFICQKICFPMTWTPSAHATKFRIIEDRLGPTKSDKIQRLCVTNARLA